MVEDGDGRPQHSPTLTDVVVSTDQWQSFPEGIDIHELLKRLPAVIQSINAESGWKRSPKRRYTAIDFVGIGLSV